MWTTGSCLCGDIRWEGDPDPESGMHHHCHCSICRKAHGSPFVTFVGVEAGDFRWLAGEEALVRYQATPDSVYQRTFCPRCGSAGPIPVAERVYMPAGCLDSDPGVRPNRHIFTGSQHNPPWFPITDGLEQYDDFGGGSPPLPVVERRGSGGSVFPTARATRKPLSNSGSYTRIVSRNANSARRQTQNLVSCALGISRLLSCC